MNNIRVELANVEISEYCMLDLATDEMSFSNEINQSGFTGLYFKDTITFFAVFPTDLGPKIYYKGKQYPIKKDLSISLIKNGKKRKFSIMNYGIEIDYRESPYIGFDVWSDEIDVDLFYMIEQSYKCDSFYEKYTL